MPGECSYGREEIPHSAFHRQMSEHTSLLKFLQPGWLPSPNLGLSDCVSLFWLIPWEGVLLKIPRLR